MVYDHFNVLLDAVCQYFVEDFSIFFVSDIDQKFSFFVVSLPGFGIRIILASSKEFGSLPFFNFLEQFEKDRS